MGVCDVCMIVISEVCARLCRDWQTGLATSRSADLLASRKSVDRSAYGFTSACYACRHAVETSRGICTDFFGLGVFANFWGVKAPKTSRSTSREHGLVYHCQLGMFTPIRISVPNMGCK